MPRWDETCKDFIGKHLYKWEKPGKAGGTITLWCKAGPEERGSRGHWQHPGPPHCARTTRPSRSPPASAAHWQSPRSPGNRHAAVSLLLAPWLGAACGSMGSEERWERGFQSLQLDSGPLQPWGWTPVRHILMATISTLRETHHSANVHMPPKYPDTTRL